MSPITPSTPVTVRAQIVDGSFQRVFKLKMEWYANDMLIGIHTVSAEVVARW